MIYFSQISSGTRRSTTGAAKSARKGKRACNSFYNIFAGSLILLPFSLVTVGTFVTECSVNAHTLSEIY